MTFRCVQDLVLVEPYYDPDKIGSIYIPDSVKDKQSQQGVVVAAGPTSEIHPGTYVLYHPWRGDPIRIGGLELLPLSRKDLVATALVASKLLFPLKGEVMVHPDWDSKYRQPSSLIYLPPTALEHNQPVMLGWIEAIGEGVESVKPGDKVIIPPGKGSEIGFDSKVYYFIHESHLLATVTYNGE